jgi:hypothetical protein
MARPPLPSGTTGRPRPSARTASGWPGAESGTSTASPARPSGRVRDEVGLSWMTPHTWRRTYATILDDEMTLTDRAKAVARAISARLTDTRMTQMDVASRAQVSPTTLCELQHNLNPRRRRPQTLAAISEALGWPADHLQQVLHGMRPRLVLDEAGAPVLDAIDNLGQRLRELRSRVEKLEQQQTDQDARR